MNGLRRLRGVLGMAATWGIALSALATASLVTGIAVGVVPSAIFGPREIGELAFRGFTAGAIAGALFAIALARSGRRASLTTLTDRGVARWGFLGGVSIPTVFVLALDIAAFVPVSVLLTGTFLFGVLGAGMAVGTLRMARRAPERLESADVSYLPR